MESVASIIKRYKVERNSILRSIKSCSRIPARVDQISKQLDKEQKVIQRSIYSLTNPCKSPLYESRARKVKVDRHMSLEKNDFIERSKVFHKISNDNNLSGKIQDKLSNHLSTLQTTNDCSNGSKFMIRHVPSLRRLVDSTNNNNENTNKYLHTIDNCNKTLDKSSVIAEKLQRSNLTARRNKFNMKRLQVRTFIEDYHKTGRKFDSNKPKLSPFPLSSASRNQLDPASSGVRKRKSTISRLLDNKLPLSKDVPSPKSILSNKESESPKSTLSFVYDPLKSGKSGPHNHEYLVFLMQLKRFETWKYDDIADLIKAMNVCHVEEGNTIYNIGDKSDYFYIILQGAVFLETNFQTSKQIRYPIGTNKWETQTVTNTISYRVAELECGDVFGHEEIISNKDRICKATAVEKALILKLQNCKFMNFFAKEIEKDRKALKNRKAVLHKDFNFFDTIDIDEIKKIHEENELTKKKGLNSILNALNLNPIEISGREMHSEDRSLNKFKYVFKKIKSNVGIGKSEIRHRDRTRIIKQKHCFSKSP
ncbi:unnamed protein product [Moneuplotes crassus]|uniref:Cyclic nucleotide-binding domain-containing protein n=1 Tax=Euplotes crassus TaxID=5936 RepID=A0AAD1U225_EUPCR|nr:unnamed protein product [Moneuplotes crassus]